MGRRHTGDYACGAMEAIYFGNAHWQGNTGGGATGAVPLTLLDIA